MVPVHQGNTIYHPAFFFFLAGFWFLTEEHVAQIKSIHSTIHWEDSPQVWMIMSSSFVLCWGKGKVYFLQIKVPRVKTLTVKMWGYHNSDIQQTLNMFLPTGGKKITSEQHFFFFTQKLLLDLENMNNVLKSHIYKVSDPSMVQNTKQQCNSRSYRS